jgi:hypothetical protein
LTSHDARHLLHAQESSDDVDIEMPAEIVFFKIDRRRVA